MADDAEQVEQAGDGVRRSPDGFTVSEAPVPREDPVERLRSNWREFWQAPVLLVGGGIMLIGVAFAVATSPKPDFGPVLVAAERLVEREEYRDAIERLNTGVHPWMDDESLLTARDRQRFHLTKARAIYYGQRKLDIEDKRNHVSVVREYLEAERQGLTLEAKDVAALADTYLSLGDLSSALRRLATLPPGSGVVRDPVIRRGVALLIRGRAPDHAEALALLADVLTDPETSMDQRVWALERQSGLRLALGFVDETVTRLLREMPRLTGAEPEGLGRLHLLLARSYRMLDADAEAAREVAYAEELSTASDGYHALVLLERARLEARAGDTGHARNTFGQIADKHADSEAYAWAMLGLGETEALLGSADPSMKAYETLVDEYDALGITDGPSREQVVESLLDRADEALGMERPSLAIRYASLGERAMGGAQAPARLLAVLASAHERAAEELSGNATTKVGQSSGLDPSARAEVQRHLMTAATNLRLHAERFVLTDIDQYADSLWRAADLFDRAGDQREAVQAFKTYTDTITSDARYAEASFRMAESLRAMGEFQEAAAVYEDLIDSREVGAVEMGAWADVSHVRLAQAYLYDEDPSNDAEAEGLLERTIDGTMVGTGADLFRDALAELAGLYDRQGRHARAIERLEELVERFPDDPEIGLLTYRLAEANRKLASEIEASLGEALPPTTRAERQLMAVERREEALSRYGAAISLLAGEREADLGRLERLSLRNAHYYVGDCLSDLGRYDDAIRAYDLARDRYPEEPATLVALVQIVNAHMARGDLRRARTANERARRFYVSLPDSAWDDPTLPMDRGDWQAWLDASARLLVASGDDGS